MSATTPAASPLDQSIASAIAALDGFALGEPKALLLMGTGADLLPERLNGAQSLKLGELPGCPAGWAGATLVAGGLGDLHVWVLEDLGLEESSRDGGASWESAWPCWLASRAGARFLLHTSAGASVDESIGRGAVVALRDHVNLSGTTPLRGLANSQIGPMFPDLSLLHDASLRQSAVESGQRYGTKVLDAVGGCTLGPALETRAEREFAERSGCGVTVQGLSTPLIAAAHAGLRACALVAVVEQPGDRLDLVRLLKGAEQAAPALEDLLVGMAPALGALVAELELDV